jgi:branched-chain amino acid transport system permease protein
MAELTKSNIAAGVVLIALAAVPWLAQALGQDYYVTFLSRVLILALAAIGLNLVLGFGGMVSMGHALYVGVGVYAVGILASNGVTSGWVHIATALVVAAALAVPLGLICLRTSGMAFIMITLAFGQMAYYGAVTLRDYGGDDGMAIPSRSNFGLLSLEDNAVLYWVIFLLLLLTLYAVRRLVRSPFGMVLRGIRINPRRMAALGYPTLGYQLVAYVLSALVCALAGVLLANLARYMSPSYLQWQVSGELVMMIVLGGMAAVIGPLYGALALLVLEELLVSLPMPLPWGLDAIVAKHPMVVVGLFIVTVAIGMKSGLHGLLARGRPDPLPADAGAAASKPIAATSKEPAC